MYNGDGTPKPIKHKYSSTFDEELGETFYFCDGVEIDPKEEEEWQGK